MTEPAPQRQSPPSRGQVLARLLGTVLAAGLVNGALASGRLVLPLVALALGASSTMVGLIAAMFTVLPIAFNVRFGRWVDEAGSRVPFLFACLLVVIGVLLFEAVPTVEVLPIVAGLIGAGAIFGHVAAARAVSDLGPRSQRVRNIGFLVVGYSAFQFATPLLAGVAFEIWGARVALIAMGAFGGLGALWLLTRLHGFATTPRAVPAGQCAVRQRSLLFHAALAPRIIVSSTFSAVQTIYPFVVSLLCIEVGLSAAHAGTMLGAFALGTVASRLSLGLAVRLGPPRLMLWLALLAGGALYAMLPVVSGYWALVLLSGLLGLPIGLGVPISMTLIYDAAPEGRANEAMGLTMTLTNSMQAATPLLMGVAASGLGTGPMIWSLCLMMAVAAVVNRW